MHDAGGNPGEDEKKPSRTPMKLQQSKKAPMVVNFDEPLVGHWLSVTGTYMTKMAS